MNVISELILYYNYFKKYSLKFYANIHELDTLLIYVETL